MSEITTTSDRDGKTGQFVTGSNGGPGRKLGSRNRLGEAFLLDLKTVWDEDGIAALRRCARDDATGFCRIIAGLMPRSVDLSVTAETDAVSFAQNFRHALELLHGGAQRAVRVIEQADASHRR